MPSPYVSAFSHAVTLNSGTAVVLMEVQSRQAPAEETLAELRQRYLTINAHACSYIMKALRPAPAADLRPGRPDQSSPAERGEGNACGAAGQQAAGAVGARGESPCGGVASDQLEPAPSCSLPGLGSGGSLPVEAHQKTWQAFPEALGPLADEGVPGGGSGGFAEAQVQELDLNATLAQCGLASPSAAKGDEPVLLLYWTDDLTPSC